MGNKTCIGLREKEFPQPLGGKLYSLVGRHIPSGRRGEIIGFDQHDKDYTFKLVFEDGQSPNVDWFPEADVELRSTPFKITVVAQGATEVVVEGLLPSDSLKSLQEKVEDKLKVARGRVQLMPDPSTYVFAYTSADAARGIGLLGLGEGAIVTAVVHDYDPSLLRLEIASEKGFIGDDGAAETWTIAALIYGEKGSKDELLVWAEDYVTRAGEEPMEPGPALSDGGLEVSTKHGIVSVGSLMAEAKARQGATTLKAQIHAKFSQDENWPRILARVCRKLIE
eukprot:gb/GFBE01020746.1/.p1 GENE.gb/GFBE01020746.1/~~gb/GFBE01020746.1/.p1  ORF type:complete len:281 (+),score=67.95 gb/GFBE01020746.1/:1-843(+)